MTEDSTRNDADIRRRAAWLLIMLAVVAGLVAFIVIEFFGRSGGGGRQDQGAPYVDPDPSATAPSSPGPGASTSPDHGSGSRSSDPSGSSPAGSSTDSSSGAPPKPSCPDDQTCTVPGDLTGVTSAINQLRSQQGHPAITATTTQAAKQCALTQGSDCPTSFVWVHVDGLSGSDLVDGVQGFGSGQDLLDDDATSFEVAWAYDPSSRSLSAAVIRDS